MKNKISIVICIVLLICITGCKKEASKNTKVSTLPNATTGTEKMNQSIDEPQRFAKSGYSKNRKLAITDRMHELLNSTDKDYTIEDKQYQAGKHSGNFDVHYPVLRSKNRDMTVVNSVILAKIANHYAYDGDTLELNTDLNYEVKTATKDYISIVFTGNEYGVESGSHVYSIHFVVNFDLRDNAILMKSAVLTGKESDITKMVHSVMKEQLDENGFQAFQKSLAEKIEKQLEDSSEEFYIDNGKIYLLVEAVEGGYYEFIGLDIG